MLDSTVALRVRDALFAQKYNLLLGAGISLDSLSRHGKPLQGAEELRIELCKLTKSRESSPLWRAAGLLTKEQVEEHLTTPYLGCKAGPTAKILPKFAWRAAYTLNIDDAVENAYEQDINRLQTIISVNYTREFETFRNPQELPLIHLHGFTRNSIDKYVFSLQEYINLQRGLNPWVHALSGLIVSEPFIIAGTSLFEPDLEYFFAHRPTNADVLARTPSIIVEPYPDAGTRKDCERLRLILVESTLDAFLTWMHKEFGNAPTPLELREPQVRPRVLSPTPVHASTAFWADFDFVRMPAAEPIPKASSPSAFSFGRPPTWKDIDGNLDVPLQSQLPLIDEVRRWQSSADPNQVLCLAGRAGAGKSTSIRRVATELSAHGLQVFFVKARGGIDTDSAIQFLSNTADPILLVTDTFAEHGDQLIEILRTIGPKKRICILAAERQYRMKLVRELLEGIPSKFFEIARWRLEERTDLVARYAALGLVANAAALSEPRTFAGQLAEDTAAEAVCRILNDFKPLRAIVRSLWNDTIASGRPAYLATALAFYCHPVGIRRDVILAMCPEDLLEELSAQDAPLRVLPDPDDPSYLMPLGTTLSSLLVEEISRIKPARLLEISVQLANALSPFVTRHTIKQRTTEARLAGRLFDADGVMPDLLKDSFNSFYDLTHDRWKWNSRYWEQRALYIGQRDRMLAIQYARHAVAIERHPYPMTTLAQILFSAVGDEKPLRNDYFAEALALMEETLRIESQWERGRTKKAYWALFEGASSYLSGGGLLTVRQSQFIERSAGEAMRLFGAGSDIHDRAQAISALISSAANGSDTVDV